MYKHWEVVRGSEKKRLLLGVMMTLLAGCYFGLFKQVIITGNTSKKIDSTFKVTFWAIEWLVRHWMQGHIEGKDRNHLRSIIHIVQIIAGEWW